MATIIKRECPHCHGSLQQYEDPTAVELLRSADRKNAALLAALKAIEQETWFDDHEQDEVRLAALPTIARLARAAIAQAERGTK